MLLDNCFSGHSLTHYSPLPTFSRFLRVIAPCWCNLPCRGPFLTSEIVYRAGSSVFWQQGAPCVLNFLYLPVVRYMWHAFTPFPNTPGPLPSVPYPFSLDDGSPIDRRLWLITAHAGMITLHHPGQWQCREPVCIIYYAVSPGKISLADQNPLRRLHIYSVRITQAGPSGLNSETDVS